MRKFKIMSDKEAQENYAEMLLELEQIKKEDILYAFSAYKANVLYHNAKNGGVNA